MTQQHGVLFATCAVGVVGAYLCYGFLQELFAATRFRDESTPESGERFEFVTATLFVQCVVNGAVAAAALALIGAARRRRRKKNQQAPFSKADGNEDKRHWEGHATLREVAGHAALAVAHAGAMAASTKAVFRVAYPTLVVAKCCKPIPVLLLGLLLGARRGKGRYPPARVLSASLVTAGVAVFMRAGIVAGGKREGGAPHSSTGDEEWWTGIGLLLLSLVLDGVAGQLQDALISSAAASASMKRRRSASVAPWHMMFWVNLFSAMLMAGAAVAAGEGAAAVRFCMRFPAAAWMVLGLAGVSAAGQSFVFVLVAHFDSLLCSIVTTARKFASILLSVAWFGHHIAPVQWAAVVVVFAGIGVEISASRKPSAPPKTTQPKRPESPPSSSQLQLADPTKSVAAVSPAIVYPANSMNSRAARKKQQQQQRVCG